MGYAVVHAMGYAARLFSYLDAEDRYTLARADTRPGTTEYDFLIAPMPPYPRDVESVGCELCTLGNAKLEQALTSHRNFEAHHGR